MPSQRNCFTCQYWNSFVNGVAGTCHAVDTAYEDVAGKTYVDMFEISWSVDDSSNINIKLITGCEFHCAKWEAKAKKEE